MSLPDRVQSDALVQRRACQKRGDCCQGWSITATRPEYVRMRRTLKERMDPRAALLSEVRARENQSGFRVLPTDDEARCIFLTESCLCGYRLSHGTDTLPGSCTRYPYQLLLAPDRFLLSLSFTCPTALGLLTEQTDAEPLEIDADRLPTDVFLNAHRSDPAFWDTWERALDRYRLASGGAERRLGAAFGLDVPQLSEQAAAMADGGGALWSAESGGDADLSDLPAVEEPETLLCRYIDHRLRAPTWLSGRWERDALATGLLSMVLRYRVERARGSDAALAIWRVDEQVTHGRWIATVLERCPHPQTLWDEVV